jgi:serine/threonine-protein kinase RsbT
VEETKLKIESEYDILLARQVAGKFAQHIGFDEIDRTKIDISISELANNILSYAKKGAITIRCINIRGIRRRANQGIEIICSDEGPGIADISLAMKDGYSSRKSLGLGLPGTQRLMDEFDIQSKPGKGTRVTIRKWKKD